MFPEDKPQVLERAIEKESYLELGVGDQAQSFVVAQFFFCDQFKINLIQGRQNTQNEYCLFVIYDHIKFIKELPPFKIEKAPSINRELVVAGIPNDCKRYKEQKS